MGTLSLLDLFVGKKHLFLSSKRVSVRDVETRRDGKICRMVTFVFATFDILNFFCLADGYSHPCLLVTTYYKKSEFEGKSCKSLLIIGVFFVWYFLTTMATMPMPGASFVGERRVVQVEGVEGVGVKWFQEGGQLVPHLKE